MGGGKTSDDHLSSESLSSSSSSSSSSDFEGPLDPSLKAYINILRSYENPHERTLTLEQYKDAIMRHKAGDWIGSGGGLTLEDYEVPEVTSLLLVGPKGSGKSSLVNGIARVFEEDKFAPDLAQVSNKSLATDGSFFLQEYMVPRNSKSLCVYDSRSLSTNMSENLSMLNAWMNQGVRHGQMVIRDSDTASLKAAIRAKARQYNSCPCQKRDVNFVIFVVDGTSVLKSVDGRDPEYNEMLFATFNYAYLSFRDTKPAVVITHGDELSFRERARARIKLAEILGVPASQIFDIPDSSDYNTELAIVDMLRYSIEHADRNLPFKQNNLSCISQIQRILSREMAKFWVDDWLFWFDNWLMTSDLLIVCVCFIFILFRVMSMIADD